jgi:hypothetical protein
MQRSQFIVVPKTGSFFVPKNSCMCYSDSFFMSKTSSLFDKDRYLFVSMSGYLCAKDFFAVCRRPVF